MGDPSKAKTPAERLALLVEHAHTVSADTMKAVLLGMSYPDNLEYTYPFLKPTRLPPHKYQIAWDAYTGENLQALIDKPPVPDHLNWEPAWLLDAWNAWREDTP